MSAKVLLTSHLGTPRVCMAAVQNAPQPPVNVKRACWGSDMFRLGNRKSPNDLSETLLTKMHKIGCPCRRSCIHGRASAVQRCMHVTATHHQHANQMTATQQRQEYTSRKLKRERRKSGADMGTAKQTRCLGPQSKGGPALGRRPASLREVNYPWLKNPHKKINIFFLIRAI